MLTVREGFYDEMLDAGGTNRPQAQTLVHALWAPPSGGAAADLTASVKMTRSDPSPARA